MTMDGNIEELVFAFHKGQKSADELRTLPPEALWKVWERLLDLDFLELAAQVEVLLGAQGLTSMEAFRARLRARLVVGKDETLAYVPHRFAHIRPTEKDAGAAVAAFLAWTHGEEIPPEEVLGIVQDRLGVEDIDDEERQILLKATPVLALAARKPVLFARGLNWDPIAGVIISLFRRLILKKRKSNRF